jgi:ABC-type sugar transport system permease subunit
MYTINYFLLSLALLVLLLIIFIIDIYFKYKLCICDYSNFSNNFISSEDYSELIKGKYYSLKGGKNAKSLISKINLYQHN